MYFVYVLYSESVDHFYVGQTEDFDLRIEQHKHKFFKQTFTARAQDWILFLHIPCISRIQAVNIETHIKRMKSRVYLRNLAKYPEMVENLKKRYSQ
jgi:putative endonuclease